jgi:hypothetical protein
LNDIKPIEKTKKLLLFLYKQTNISDILHISVEINRIKLNLNNVQISNDMAPILWARSKEEVLYLIEELVKRNYMEYVGNSNINVKKVRITTQGFEYIEKIDNTGSSDIGFCAMWFNSSMENAWISAIYPAIQDTGYSPKRIDIHDHNNVILEEIEGLIRQSKFIIVDLTRHRGGVYFEAGFAKALQKTVIYTCEQYDFENIHFDVKHFNCLKWSKNDLPDFKVRLHKRIENTLGRGIYYK